ncbi:hypothetical protein EVAR_42443_1 [Eumeta japonica]|uniref:Uncharacterized protein n=1 Tax=Eumeta variegata TaxID=151549 RepID=A0A4C1Y111_EUMVA|nr:hypothetical protein EVAR_42443_1 [Eumeta japonica]
MLPYTAGGKYGDERMSCAKEGGRLLTDHESHIDPCRWTRMISNKKLFLFDIILSSIIYTNFELCTLRSPKATRAVRCQGRCDECGGYRLLKVLSDAQTVVIIEVNDLVILPMFGH